MTNVYLLDLKGNPLMPCHDGGFIRILLKQNKARVVKSQPFTVRLLYEVRNKYKQDITLGVDAGYKYIGFSASTKKAELFSAELEQDCGMVERNKKRRVHRKCRRAKLRHRKQRIDNHTSSKPKGWIAPSLARKRDTHLKFIKMICEIMPISKIVVETGLFDPHLMKATAEGRTLSGIDYQKGEAEGFENMKAYIRFRDNYTCQNPNCKCHSLNEKEKKDLRLEVHHIGYWKKDRSNRPGNLITLCSQYSHTAANHEKDGFLYGWDPKTRSLKESAFMNTVRFEMVDRLKEMYPHIEVDYCYGYETNITRNEWKLNKSHANDAFCITGNYTIERAETLYFKQHRRNNRSLEKQYDAKYIDSRDGKVKTGKELNNGRTTRNRELADEDLHIYRQQKVKKGRRSIRKQHYMYQPDDIVLYDNQKYIVKGTHNAGKSVQIINNNMKKSIDRGPAKLKILKYNRGIYCLGIKNNR